MEEKVFFKSGGLKLEGLFSRGINNKGMIVSHPHPLMGGDMYSIVVETIVRAGIEKGYTTLRFNFRGAGRSEGAFDEGIGEQKDVRAAVDYLKSQGADDIRICGYSFGCWVNALFSDGKEPAYDMMMVSPPVNFIRFRTGMTLPGLSLVITGSDDEYATPEHIKEHLPKWNKNIRFEVIEGADHFYFGFTDDLKEILISHL